MNITSKDDDAFINSAMEENNINYKSVEMMDDIYNSYKYSTNTNKLIELYELLNRNKSLKLEPNFMCG